MQPSAARLAFNTNYPFFIFDCLGWPWLIAARFCTEQRYVTMVCYTVPLSLPLLLLHKYLCRKLAASAVSVQTAKLYITIAGWAYVAVVIWLLYFFSIGLEWNLPAAGLFYAVLHSFATACFTLRE